MSDVKETKELQETEGIKLKNKMKYLGVTILCDRA